MGKWYLITYSISTFDFEDWSYCQSEETEVVFTESVAKHILNKAKKFKDDPRCLPEYRTIFFVQELSLLTSDGQKITGFKPKSIAHLL